MLFHERQFGGRGAHSIRILAKRLRAQIKKESTKSQATHFLGNDGIGRVYSNCVPNILGLMAGGVCMPMDTSIKPK